MGRLIKRTPQHEEERKRDLDRKIDEWIALFTVVLALLTGLMLWSAWF